MLRTEHVEGARNDEPCLINCSGMIEFKIIKKSKKSRARLGVLSTPHGEVETPAFVPVATQAVVKTLTSEDLPSTKTQIIISNTFHLHLKPGEDIVKAAGGIHRFANLNVPIMTDSAGFQVFSLGFGHDLGIGKLLKTSLGQDTKIVEENAHPSNVKITDYGATFQSPVDGSELFIGPKESIKIQEALRADIIFAFDECTPPTATFGYVKRSLGRTHKWAEICLDTKKSKQAIYGIIQGSHYKELREESAMFINSLPFDGFGIGGDFGEDKEFRALDWTLPFLDEHRPRHLLGIGYLEDIENVVRAGIDTFDCIVPTHYARRGVAFTSEGKLDLERKVFLKVNAPLDLKCKCVVCQNYTKSYISHLVRAKEITGLRLLTLHNLYFFNNFVEKIREKIALNKL